MTAGRRVFRGWLPAFALCAIAVVVCIEYVDRGIADYFEANLRHTGYWVALDRALRPLALVAGIAPLFLLGCGIWIVLGHQLRGWTGTPLLCSWSVIGAVAADFALKRFFGRTWPDPAYVQNRLYEFRLLRGAAPWASFPSGTAAISAAIASVLWILVPDWRLPALLGVVLLSAAVVVGNYHWLSDVIAGAFLGVSIGWTTVRFLHSPS